MSDLLSGPHGHSTADLHLASVYPQLQPVTLITRPKHLMRLRGTTEVMSLISARGSYHLNCAENHQTYKGYSQYFPLF